MLRSVIFCFIATYSLAASKSIVDRNLDLFKYDPSDIYTLPDDIDDEKPAVIFVGDVMKAKVEKLQNLNGPKKFKLDLKTQNGIEVTSVGKLKDDKTFVVSGSYSFTGADGKRYKTRYTADELGYHPITELDLDIPEPQALESTPNSNNFGFQRSSSEDEKKLGKNRFQFLNRELDSEYDGSVLRGSNLSGDDYSFFSDKEDYGYNYNPPSEKFVTAETPQRNYLPVH